MVMAPQLLPQQRATANENSMLIAQAKKPKTMATNKRRKPMSSSH